LQLQEKVLVSNIFFLIIITRYRLFKVPLSPVGEVGNFPQQFQYFTPTTPIEHCTMIKKLIFLNKVKDYTGWLIKQPNNYGSNEFCGMLKGRVNIKIKLLN
jgi:hypothetical protein